MKTIVINKIKEIFVLNENEKDFIMNYNNGIFNQKLLFENYEINDLSYHPMIIWKTNIKKA